MIFHRKFEVADDAVERLLADMPAARLITIADDGTPHLGIYPYIFGAGWIEVHLAQPDEQLADLRSRPRAAIEIDEVFGSIPSHWTGPEATNADVYYRAVVFDVEAELSSDTNRVASHLEALLGRYQPEGGFDPIDSTPSYRKYMAMLTVVRLRVVRRRTKFKLGQQESAAARALIHDQLRRRGRTEDLRALSEAVSITL